MSFFIQKFKEEWSFPKEPENKFILLKNFAEFAAFSKQKHKGKICIVFDNKNVLSTIQSLRIIDADGDINFSVLKSSKKSPDISPIWVPFSIDTIISKSTNSSILDKYNTFVMSIPSSKRKEISTHLINFFFGKIGKEKLKSRLNFEMTKKQSTNFNLLCDFADTKYGKDLIRVLSSKGNLDELTTEYGLDYYDVGFLVATKKKLAP
jgi:hypothetical protein